MALLTAGSTAEVVVGVTDFAPEINRGLDAIEATDGPTRLPEAIQVARRLIGYEEALTIRVFSDGQIADDEKEILDADDVVLTTVGTSRDNVAITGFQTRRTLSDPLGYSILVELQNFSSEPAAGRLRLTLQGELVDVIPWSISADGVWERTISATSQQGGVLQASIDYVDHLDVDNRATSILSARSPVSVRVISNRGEADWYLRSVLQSIPLLNTVDDRDDAVGHGLTVFCGVVPDKLPDGPVMLVGPPKNGPPIDSDNGSVPAWKLGPPLEQAFVAQQHDASPLLQHVTLQNTLMGSGRDVQVAQQLGTVTTLLEAADGSSLFVAVDRPKGRLLILSTDIVAGDLPLRIAFPVLMTNAVNWFAHRTADLIPAMQTGKTATIFWEGSSPKDNQLALLTNSGRSLIPVSQNHAFPRPFRHTGIAALLVEPGPPSDIPTDRYRRLLGDLDDDQYKLVAVNLCDAEESNLRVAEAEPSSTAPTSSHQPLWLMLVAGGFIVVLIEWGLFNRRIVA